MEYKDLAPPKAANMLLRAADLFIEAHGGNKFPINVDEMARGAASLFNWKDPITEIQAVNLKNFEGLLAANDSKTKWMIAFNESIASEGRIRFTKAHELGHYMLHRNARSEFMCSKDDILNGSGEVNIEAEADKFASHLLMPINDFRSQVTSKIDFDNLRHCAERYGVSLTATVLKWLSFTEEKALLISSRDGFMNWAVASSSALKSGAYFKTRNNVIEVPEGTLALKENVSDELVGQNISARRWFPNADDAEIRELKITSEQYDCILSLLILPKHLDCWENKEL